jgi:hypothetical protein
MARHRGRPEGKKRGGLARAVGKTDVRKRILVVCEGERTEPAYFRRLVSFYGITTARVEIRGDGGSAPISVVDHAISILKKDDDFELVYLVFDRDRHHSYDEALDKARALKKKRGVNLNYTGIITSVPCFEVWFKLHVSGSRKPYSGVATGISPAKELIDEMKALKQFADYEKSECDFFDEIIQHVDDATNRAVGHLMESRKDGERQYHENPSTRVYKIVDTFKSMRSN